MNDIISLVFKSISGDCPVEYQYSDCLTLTRNGIDYKYEPAQPSEDNKPSYWSYQTDSHDFLNRFASIVEKTAMVMDENFDTIIPENPCTIICVNMADGRQIETQFTVYDSESLNDLYISILSLLPICESLPIVLGLIDEDDDATEDWAEDDEDDL